MKRGIAVIDGVVSAKGSRQYHLEHPANLASRLQFSAPLPGDTAFGHKCFFLCDPELGFGLVRKVSGIQQDFRFHPKDPVVGIFVVVAEELSPEVRDDHNVVGQPQGRHHSCDGHMRKLNLGG